MGYMTEEGMRIWRQRECESRRYDTADIAVMSVVIVVLLAVGLILWYEWEHPCLKEETWPCEQTYCAVETFVACGDGCLMPTCVMYQTRTVTCSRCVVRGKRGELPSEAP